MISGYQLSQEKRGDPWHTVGIDFCNRKKNEGVTRQFVSLNYHGCQRGTSLCMYVYIYMHIHIQKIRTGDSSNQKLNLARNIVIRQGKRERKRDGLGEVWFARWRSRARALLSPPCIPLLILSSQIVGFCIWMYHVCMHHVQYLKDG